MAVLNKKTAILDKGKKCTDTEEDDATISDHEFS